MNALFHLAFPVKDLESTRRFYTDVLGCRTGAEDRRWIDFDFYGHQITAHLVDAADEVPTNDVDGHAVPARHFGAILERGDWEALAKRLTDAGTEFIIEPHLRFEGQEREQATMFFRDPCGNYLEFKSFSRPETIFQSG